MQRTRCSLIVFLCTYEYWVTAPVAQLIDTYVSIEHRQDGKHSFIQEVQSNIYDGLINIKIELKYPFPSESRLLPACATPRGVSWAPRRRRWRGRTAPWGRRRRRRAARSRARRSSSSGSRPTSRTPPAACPERIREGMENGFNVPCDTACYMVRPRWLSKTNFLK